MQNQRRSPAQHVARGVLATFSSVAAISGLYVAAPLLVGDGKWRPRTRLAEWLSASAISLVRPLSILPERRHPGARPVILLHGYAMSRTNFLWLAKRLRNAGIGPCYGFEYWTLGGIERPAAKLAEMVEQVCERHGVESVDLVGHSMGGIVARHYICVADGAERVGRVVTLGSPHAGTKTSPMGIGRARFLLAPQSEYLRMLADSPIPDGVQATSIWSRDDDIVVPVESGVWAGAESCAVEGIGHLSLLTHRRVADEVVRRLASE